ncbi:hypothetical protein JD969_09705 [Planctomycetota bacterium]|nr:hypothetical protein JD969_09705 [Planctomycetota bacterium]
MKRKKLIITLTILIPLSAIAFFLYSALQAMRHTYPYMKTYDEVSYPHVTSRYTHSVRMLTDLDAIPYTDTTHLHFFLDKKEHKVFNYQLLTTNEKLATWLESEPALKSLTPRTDSFTLPYNHWPLTDLNNQPLITNFRLYQFKDSHNRQVSILIDDKFTDAKMVYLTIDLNSQPKN